MAPNPPCFGRTNPIKEKIAKSPLDVNPNQINIETILKHVILLSCRL